MDRFAPERKLSEQVRDLENQLEGLRSERVEEIAKLSSEKKALQDRLHDAESQILQLKRKREELKKVVKEKDAIAEGLKRAEAGRKRSDEELKRYETENVTREETRQSLEDEIRRLRQTVGQTEGEKRKKEERIAVYEERIHGMQARLEAYEEYIQSLATQLREEMIRHAPLYGAYLDTLSTTELETVSRIHEEGLIQIHAIWQQRRGSPLSSPTVSPHTLPPHNHGLYPNTPPQVAVGLPPSVMPNGVGMHHSNGHVNDELKKKPIMSSSTASAAAGTSQEESFPPPPVPVPATDPASTSSSLGSGGMTQAFCFSSGNPRIEETHGVMHLFPDDAVSSSSSDLPVGRKPLICVFGVPDHMKYADLCQFCASFIHHILEMRIVRTDQMEDRYSILIRMDGQDSTDNFYRYFNGRRFNSLEVEVCRILYTVDVQYTGYKGSVEQPQTSPVATSEQPSCPVCLERLDQDASGILTTICNHSFHISCISKWSDSSCPVCRFCQQQPEKSVCFVCQTSENLWMCVICGFVGCGRYKGKHAIVHWKETHHCYSLELETQSVWDYAGDNYVHRLIQSKTDGKLVALNSHCMHSRDGCGSCNCADSGLNEALFKSKAEVMVKEYDDWLATQMESQKLYYETLLQEFEEETEREISEAVEMALGTTSKVQKNQAKLDKCVRDKEFLDELNKNLMANQGIWKANLLEAEERERSALRAKDDKIQQLEEELKELMAYLEEGNS